MTAKSFTAQKDFFLFSFFLCMKGYREFLFCRCRIRNIHFSKIARKKRSPVTAFLKNANGVPSVLIICGRIDGRDGEMRKRIGANVILI